MASTNDECLCLEGTVGLLAGLAGAACVWRIAPGPASLTTLGTCVAIVAGVVLTAMVVGRRVKAANHNQILPPAPRKAPGL
jgi:hypothetical protein